MSATVVQDRFWFTIIGIMSAAGIAAVAFVLTGPRLGSGLDVSSLPAVNTAWNATAAVLLVAALVAIRRRAVPVHRALVLSAFAASSLFLAGYLLYHSFSDGPERYGGAVPWLYYATLISHIILAVTIVPLALVTLRLGWTFHPRHRAVARITFPIWLYVSVTGVLIYLVLHLLDP